MARDPHSVLMITGADLRRGAPGGTRAYVLGLSRFLAGKGVSVSIVSNGSCSDTPPGITRIPISKDYLPSTMAFQRTLRTWAMKANWTQYSVVHFQRPDDLWAVGVAAIPRAVCTLHGDAARGVTRRHGPMAGLVYRRREGLALPRFSALIAVDERTSDAYSRRYPAAAGRISVVPVAVDDLFLGSHKASPPSAEPTFVYVGRLSVEKRVNLIIKSLKSSELQGARLRIAGSGPLEEELRESAAGMNVEFLGAVPTEELPNLYRTADGLVLASEYEGLPTVALEALASGCPVVAFAGSGLDPLLADGRGVLVDRVTSLREALVRCRQMRLSKCRISLPEQYTWPAVGEQVMKIYGWESRRGSR